MDVSSKSKLFSLHLRLFFVIDADTFLSFSL